VFIFFLIFGKAMPFNIPIFKAGPENKVYRHEEGKESSGIY